MLAKETGECRGGVATGVKWNQVSNAGLTHPFLQGPIIIQSQGLLSISIFKVKESTWLDGNPRWILGHHKVQIQGRLRQRQQCSAFLMRHKWKIFLGCWHKTEQSHWRKQLFNFHTTGHNKNKIVTDFRSHFIETPFTWHLAGSSNIEFTIFLFYKIIKCF